MRKIAGYYYAAGQSTAIRATASESETGSIRLYAEEDQQQLVFSAPSQHQSWYLQRALLFLYSCAGSL